MLNPKVSPLLAERCALLDARAPERADAERFVRAAYRAHFNARLEAFPPMLFALYGRADLILAVAGLRPAATEPLFLEIYLDEPIELALARRTGSSVARAQTIEVGSLATRAPGYARTLIQSLTALLYHRQYDWVVFTAVHALRNTFRRLGLAPLPLCAADPARLADPGAWGSYYEHAPQVMYGNVLLGYRRLQGLAASDPAAPVIHAAAAMARGPA